ncbi:unnamed protein product [Pedinophyceae sp. YPF-701]|nr:unnamed protein product [Pedinophyceae sp. YPF-701]
MSSGVFQPVGQKRLTNVAIVRMKKGGKRFEVACYKNKVLNWRSGVERDLDEVLQSESVFQNVSKGVLAKKEDLERVFGTTDSRAVCLIILEKGQLQVSEGERKVEIGTLFKDVCSVLVDKTINPTTGKPYTHTMIERALKEIGFAVDVTKPAKPQALAVLPRLQTTMPIVRAQMRIAIDVPEDCEKPLRDMISQMAGHLEHWDLPQGRFRATFLVEPARLRDINDAVSSFAGKKWAVDILSRNAAAPTATAAQAPSAANPLDGATDVQAATEEAERHRQAQDQVARMQARQHAARSGFAAPMPQRAASDRAARGRRPAAQALAGDVVYRGAVQGLPEEFESRKERFAELDRLQGGWEVELRRRDGGVVDAVFYEPGGGLVGTFADARRQALKASKAAQAEAAGA